MRHGGSGRVATFINTAREWLSVKTMPKPQPVEEEPRRVYRSASDKMLGGVCGGIAEYFNVDSVLVRLLFIALALSGGIGVIIYMLALFMIPKKPVQ